MSCIQILPHLSFCFWVRFGLVCSLSAVQFKLLPKPPPCQRKKRTKFQELQTKKHRSNPESIPNFTRKRNVTSAQCSEFQRGKNSRKRA